LFGNNELFIFFKRNKFVDPESIFRAAKCTSLRYSRRNIVQDDEKNIQTFHLFNLLIRHRRPEKNFRPQYLIEVK